jgi:DNA-binding beta-propeller fold protein YncE
MPDIAADEDARPVEAQQGTGSGSVEAEGEPAAQGEGVPGDDAEGIAKGEGGPVEGEGVPGDEVEGMAKGGPVEAEGEPVAQGEGVPGDEAEGVAGGEGGPVEAEGGPSEGEAGLAEGEEPPAGGPDLEVSAEGAVASDAALDDRVRQAELEDRRRRRRLLGLLAFLLVALGFSAWIFVRYLTRPAPLPDLLPVPVELNYVPHYLFSIYELSKPVGVAVSPQADRIYVAEAGGERQVKIFDRNGNLLGSCAPPRTGPAERSPVYLATDGDGRVFVADRLQHALFVYDRQGSYLDTILGPDLTLSEYVSEQAEELAPGAAFAHDAFETVVYYQPAGEAERTLPVPEAPGWSPLGVRIDAAGRMLITDVAPDQQSVREIPADALDAASWRDFDPPGRAFGAEGQGDGQFLFPNVAVTDSQGRIYVTDGNNSRISVWSDQGEFLFDFGRGAGEGALNLPRGAVIDTRDRLHVVDAIGQTVRVYDVSVPEPEFLFTFGYWGSGDGQFNYPNDIALDATGRLYVADRENHRVQVWSY